MKVVWVDGIHTTGVYLLKSLLHLIDEIDTSKTEYDLDTTYIRRNFTSTFKECLNQLPIRWDYDLRL